MSTALLPLGATVAPAALTWRCCLRPMRRGHRCLPAGDQSTSSAATDIDSQLAAARAELSQLRATRATPGADPETNGHPRR